MLGRVGVDHLVHHYLSHRGKVESTLEDIGTGTLKNIAEPMGLGACASAQAPRRQQKC